MARGMGMKSLSRASIIRAIDHPGASHILLGIETYNATTLDRESNLHGQALAKEFPILTHVGAAMLTPWRPLVWARPNSLAPEPSITS